MIDLTTPGRLQRVQTNLDRLVATGVLDGAIVGIGDASGSTWFATSGVGTVGDEQVELTTDHRFLLTSVTKTFTSTQILLLVEEGLLDLDTPVCAYVPEFERHGKSTVTMRHLLTHTGGLNDTANLIEGPASAVTGQDCIDAALGAGLSFEPGASWAYCSPGFWVMAEVINRLRDRPHPVDLAKALAAPLGLTDTRYETGDAVPDRYIVALTDGAWDEHLPEQVRRVAYPAGGLVSTAPDLIIFGQSFLAGSPQCGTLLGPSSHELLFDRHAQGWNMGRQVGWSLGWETPGPGNLQSPGTLFHHGASGTGLWVDPEAGLTVALVTANWWLGYRFYAEILNSVLGSISR